VEETPEEASFKLLVKTWEDSVSTWNNNNKSVSVGMTNHNDKLNQVIAIPVCLSTLLLSIKNQNYLKANQREKIDEDSLQLIDEMESYQSLLRTFNQQLLKEQEDFQSFYIHEMKHFLQKYTRELIQLHSSSSSSSSHQNVGQAPLSPSSKLSLHFIHSEYALLQMKLKEIHFSDLMKRQRLELKHFYASLMIFFKNPLFLQFLSFYQKKPVDKWLLSPDGMDVATEEKESTTLNGSLSSLVSLLSVACNDQLFKETEQFMKKMLLA
jgi:hypothetical protein